MIEKASKFVTEVFCFSAIFSFSTNRNHFLMNYIHSYVIINNLIKSLKKRFLLFEKYNHYNFVLKTKLQT